MNRRRFLLTTAGLLSVPSAAFAAPMVSKGVQIRLVDAHTGKVFDGTYRNAKGPIGHVMDELCLFLRDEHTGGVTNIDVGVIDFLGGVLAAIDQPSATVLSAYRSLQTNAKLERTTFGVADNSQHLYGRALDIAFPAAILPEAVTAARAMKRGGVGWYPKSGFVHLDSGPVRNWDLGAEGLQDELLKSPVKSTPQPTLVSRKPTGPMLVEGHGRLTVGGGKPTVVTSGPTLRLKDGQVAGLFQPLPKAP